MNLGASEHHREWYAVSVDEQVALGTRPAAVYRVGAGLLSPFFAGTLAESNGAWDQSMRPISPSLSSNARRRRRQQVTPLQPISLGTIRQGIPLLKT